jgi:Zn-dependent M28 family amino/carboxypeptidase
LKGKVANALAGLCVKPKRSLAFVAFFGEERGKLGSRYYSQYPSFPLERTVANINLEQIGRTDDSDGAQIARASLTGFDYSDVGQVFQQAGTEVGILIVRRRKYSDSYFRAGDSQIFADLGIPAQMLFVSYELPDYHRPGDDWNKIDYENMRKITQAVALGVLAIANNPEPPQWNETNPKAKPYIEAGRRYREH